LSLLLLIAIATFVVAIAGSREKTPAAKHHSSIEGIAEIVASSAEQSTGLLSEDADDMLKDEADDAIKTIESPSADHLVAANLDPKKKGKLAKMIADLPPLPRAAMNLLPMLSNPAINAREIAKVVSSDPLLAAKILRRVNSSYYGLLDKVDSIQHAVMLIGFNNIRSITLRESFDSTIETHAIDELTANLLWGHSAAISLFAKHLSQKTPGVDPELASTAGLLHDIGLLVMMALERQKLSDALKLSAKEYLPLCTAEERIFGYNHQVLGEMLCVKWNLSDELVGAIGKHHSPASGDDLNPSAAVIWFAHNAALKFGYAYRLVAYPLQESEQLAAKIGIKWPILSHITQTLLRDLQKATLLWEIPNPMESSTESAHTAVS